MDLLAAERKVESLYLHVDVENDAALALYAKSGFHLLDPTEPMYKEFTTSLNLHDGATKGRRHHLLCKHLLTPTWLRDDMDEKENNAGNQPMTTSIGFEIPA